MPDAKKLDRAIAAFDMQNDTRRFPKGSVVTREDITSGVFDVLLSQKRLIPESEWLAAPVSAIRSRK